MADPTVYTDPGEPGAPNLWSLAFSGGSQDAVHAVRRPTENPGYPGP